MLLKCTACGAGLDGDSVGGGRNVVVCPYCKAITRLEDVREGDVAKEQRPVERPRVALPAKFQVDEAFGELRIRRRWFTPAILFLAVFCVAWDSFLVFWYTMAFETNAPWIFVVFPVVHLTVGVVLTYVVITCFFNTTTITAGQGRLTVRHGPLPWPGGTELETADIDQIYCEENVRRNDGNESRTYAVFTLTRGGVKRKLLGMLADAEMSLFIEQKLEEFLRIRDRPVAGEMPR